ncbi:hypothetical protein [Natronoglomus mannanivorans]|uniref:Uncharacterized protein n=1 Tax=Natronoglomus mannanivorans TaxID=2979990 RepID=A0AAP3E2S9_9EURY|nr:hypothetical protein [Halobacteria archaeon AArc-xg1-1]
MSGNDEGGTGTSYGFYPIVRPGLRPGSDEQFEWEPENGDVGSVDPDTVDAGELGITLTVAGGDENLDVDLDARLFGPGDVTGLDDRTILRQEPSPNADAHPPTQFPLVEFGSAELPWLFSPQRADESGRTHPWLCLVVIDRDRRGVSYEPVGPKSMPIVETPVDELPDPAESWAWAHAQLLGDHVDGAAAAVLEELAEPSTATRSRLISPRNLEAKTRYRACVVPTFEAGRLTGLGRDPADAERAFAWGDDGSVRLPVYHSWTFTCAAEGDFRTLADKLDPQPADDGIGTSFVDVTDPGPPALVKGAVPETDRGVVTVTGALRSPHSPSIGYQDDVGAELRRLLNRTEAVDEELELGVVGPPLYGQWPARVDRLPETPPDVGDDEWTAEVPRWFDELNGNPTHRGAAGFGTVIVNDLQEEWMDEAWNQFDGIAEANAFLARSQLFRDVNAVRFDHLAALPDDELIGLTESIHGHVRLESGGTVLDRIETDPDVRGRTRPSFRNLTRSNGPVARRPGVDIENASVLGADGADDGIGSHRFGAGWRPGSGTYWEGIHADDPVTNGASLDDDPRFAAAGEREWHCLARADTSAWADVTEAPKPGRPMKEPAGSSSETGWTSEAMMVTEDAERDAVTPATDVDDSTTTSSGSTDVDDESADTSAEDDRTRDASRDDERAGDTSQDDEPPAWVASFVRTIVERVRATIERLFGSSVGDEGGTPDDRRRADDGVSGDGPDEVTDADAIRTGGPHHVDSSPEVGGGATGPGIGDTIPDPIDPGDDLPGPDPDDDDEDESDDADGETDDGTADGDESDDADGETDDGTTDGDESDDADGETDDGTADGDENGETDGDVDEGDTDDGQSEETVRDRMLSKLDRIEWAVRIADGQASEVAAAEPETADERDAVRRRFDTEPSPIECADEALELAQAVMRGLGEVFAEAERTDELHPQFTENDAIPEARRLAIELEALLEAFVRTRKALASDGPGTVEAALAPVSDRVATAISIVEWLRDGLGSRDDVGPETDHTRLEQAISGTMDAAAECGILSSVSVDPATIADELRTHLDPEETFRSLAARRLGVDQELLTARATDGARERDALGPVLAAPTFPRPMYEPLAEREPEWFLPGLEEVERNSVMLVKTNPAFIEGYMAGLNHEFARELRWRKFPADRRGTYFRRFWDRTGNPALDPDDPEDMADIAPMHEWREENELGANPPAGGDDGAKLVLLVRGELLQRYPNTTVYATDAIDATGGENSDTGERVPGLPDTEIEAGDDEREDIKFPVFEGTIGSDVTFYGFDLDLEDALYEPYQDEGEAAADRADAGWFFVFEEPAAEPRFGLLDPENEDERLANPGGHVTVAATDPPFDPAQVEDADEERETGVEATDWGRNAAHVAKYTWQQPYRVAIHASTMLEAEGSEE